MLNSGYTSFRQSAAQPVTLDEITRRICVRPPYYALENLLWQDGVLQATATAEVPAGTESGPMRGAELSRHAAIAGLCAAALSQDDDKRRYYLAQEATYEGFECPAPFGTPVTLRAETLELDKRQARARITAACGGQPLAILEVKYTILTEAAFERLFRSRFVADSPTPLEMAAVPAGTTRWEDGALVRVVPTIPPEACAGHFDHYPAMPVAILMAQLSQLAAECFSGGEFWVSRASVVAHDFCWAGERARFVVEPGKTTPRQGEFECAAFAEERPAGKMQLTLQRRRVQ